jgi:hypothetical protein
MMCERREFGARRSPDIDPVRLIYIPDGLDPHAVMKGEGDPADIVAA